MGIRTIWARIHIRELLSRHQAMNHNPADTIAAAEEYAGTFRNIHLVCVDDPSSLPAEAQETIRSRGGTVEKVRGYFDEKTGAVYLNAKNVRPSEAAEVINHEIIGHQGLRAVIGETNWNEVLDQVYASHLDTIEAKARQYGLETDEDGNLTESARREAAEEYMAECAEFGGRDYRTYFDDHTDDIAVYALKHDKLFHQDAEQNRELIRDYMRDNGDLEIRTGKWRALLQKIRMALQSMFGRAGVQKLYTDRDIETLLMRSAAAMRKTSKNRENSGNGRYVNKKLAAVWSQSVGVQFPGEALLNSRSPYIIHDNDEKVKRFMIGDKMSDVMGKIPVEQTDVPLLKVDDDVSVIKTVFDSFPDQLTAADGNAILLRNEEFLYDQNHRRIQQDSAERLINRINHLTRFENTENGVKKHEGKLDPRKYRWLPRVPETLGKAQIKLEDPDTKCLAYVRRYPEGFHLVLVTPDGQTRFETGIDNKLITQFKERFMGRKGGFISVWENASWANHTDHDGLRSDLGGVPLPERIDFIIPQDGGKVNTPDERKHENGSDVSDKSDGNSGNGRFMLEEEMPAVKDESAYLQLLDEKSSSGMLKLTVAQKEKLKEFYRDFPLGKAITNPLGEKILFRPRPGSSVHEYIHHFAVKRGKDSSGKLWENYSDSHVKEFPEIEKTIQHFDERIIGGSDLLDENKSIIGFAPRVYYIRNIGKEHLVVVSVEPDTMLLTWTHMMPGNKYLNTIRDQERNYFEQYGVMDRNGKKQNLTWDEYQKEKRLTPLYLATAGGKMNLLSQMTDSNPKHIIPQDGGKVNTPDERKLENGSNVSDQSDGNSGRFMIAPDQTESAAFKRWFGNSKVVDKDGKPLEVYHGTDYDFSVFTSHDGKDEYFFTNSENAARDYGEKQMKVFLQIQNPHVVDLNGEGDAAIYDAIDYAKSNGNDGVIAKNAYDGANTHTEYVVFKKNQINSATDNIGTFDPKKKDIRYSLEDVQDEHMRDLVKMIKPLVHGFLEFDGPHYAKLLKDRYNLDVDPTEAKIAAADALKEKQSEGLRRSWEKAYEFFRETSPMFAWVEDFCGADFQLAPTENMGEKFTGSWISPEYVKYSEKRSQGKKENRSSYQRYLTKREEKLKHAKGYKVDEVAEGISRKYGMDYKQTYEEIVDLFRDLKRTDVRHAWAQFKKENFAKDQMEMEEAKLALRDHERARIEDEVTDVLSQGQAIITADWVAEHRDTYKELYRQLLKKEVPNAYSPGKLDMESLNHAITQEAGNAEIYAQAYKDARKAASDEMMKRISEFRDRVRQGKEDALKLQKEANAFLKRHLPPEYRSAFQTRIIDLMKKATPDARIKAFDQLCRDIVDVAGTMRKQDWLERLKTRLGQLGRRVDSGRKAIGVRAEDIQRSIDEIRDIAGLDPVSIGTGMDELQIRIEQALSDGERTDDLQLRLARLEEFGALEQKSAAALEAAYRDLESLARTGRDQLKDQIAERSAGDEEKVRDICGLISGSRELSDYERQLLQDRRKKKWRSTEIVEAGFWDTLNLWGIFDAINLATGKELRNTEFYRMMEATHQAARDKDTLNREQREDIKRVIEQIFGTKSGIDRAKRIAELRETVKNTGVYRLWPDKNDGKSFEYDRYTVEEAKKLLADYDRHEQDGRTPTVLKSYEAEAIRAQLDTLDKHVSFKSDSVDQVTGSLLKAIEAEDRLLRETESGEKDEPMISIPKAVYEAMEKQLEMSQMEALTYYLWWNQRDVRYKMEYNGFSETTMNQLIAFLDPKVRQFGDWMVKQLKSDRTRIDPVYQKIYFTLMDSVENYFPSYYGERKNQISGKGTIDMGKEGAGAKPMGYTPGALKTRVFHLTEPKKCDALTLFQNHRLQMNHFVTHAESARILRAVFLNPHVKNMVEDLHGSACYKALKDQIRDFINGGNIDAETNWFWQTMYSGSVRSKMAINITSGLKQTLGAITYMQDIPARDLIKGTAYAYTHPKEVWATLGDTDYFRNRWASGANQDLRLLLDATGRSAGIWQEIMGKSDTVLSIPLRLGDSSAVLFGGFAVYQYHYDQLIKRGATEAEAKAKAILEWEMSTERTQQSSQTHMLNKIQKSPWAKPFSTFMSNQILLWNNYMPRLAKGDIRGGANGMLTLILSSAAMTAMNQMMRHGVKFDDWEFWDFLYDTLSDMLCGGGAPVVSVIKGVNEWKNPGRTSDMLAGDIASCVRGITRYPADIENADWDRAMLDTVKILQGLGLFVPPLQVVSVAAREGRKWWNIFAKDED